MLLADELPMRVWQLLRIPTGIWDARKAKAPAAVLFFHVWFIWF